MDSFVDDMSRAVALQGQLLTRLKNSLRLTPIRAPRRSREDLERDFEAKVAQVQMDDYHMSTIFFGEPYLPSVMPIRSLDPMTLAELRLEHHHRGRVLFVKTFCQPIRSSGIQNAIEDVQGNVDLISVYNLPSDTPVESVLPKSAVVAVKEPYYEVTLDGGVVRVDHPSDCVLLKPDGLLVPGVWKTVLSPTMTASQLRGEGDRSFKQHKWKEAARFFTEALVKTDNTQVQLRLELILNRAEVYLHLGYYELAEQDALEALVPLDVGWMEVKEWNSRAHYRAGRAQYLLGNFIVAKNHLEQALSLDPAEKAFAAELERIRQRVQELEMGEFNFTAMAQSVTSTNRRLDHASFTSNTRIGPAGYKGRGLFATKDIKHGGLVMVEKAFCVNFGEVLGKDTSIIISLYCKRQDGLAQSECLYGTIHKMRQNHKQGSKLLDLANGREFSEKELNHIDGTVVVDAFQVHAILGRNGFNCARTRSTLNAEEDLASSAFGIWTHAAYANHSCLPNTSRAFFGDMMIVRATRDIKSGDEILMDYAPGIKIFASRQQSLDKYGFLCDCALCCLQRRLELQDSPLSDGGTLTQEVYTFIAIKEAFSQPIPATIVALAKDILRRVDATYDNYGCGSLPRLAGVKISIWLLTAEIAACQARPSSKPDLDVATRPLQNLGYRIDLDGYTASIDRTNGVVCPETVDAANLARRAFHLAGMMEVALQLHKFAKEVYIAMVGNLDGFKPNSVIPL